GQAANPRRLAFPAQPPPKRSAASRCGKGMRQAGWLHPEIFLRSLSRRIGDKGINPLMSGPEQKHPRPFSRSFPANGAVWLFSLFLTAPADARIDFVREVRPILETHCYECHSGETRKSGLRLDVKAA